MVEYMTLRLLQKIFSIEIYMRIIVDDEVEGISVKCDVVYFTLPCS
jgi:hypothetical protein